jgi:hypothetical protein
VSGLDEWYEKEEAEEADEAPEVTLPKGPSPNQPPSGASPQAESLKGWNRSGIGLGYYGLHGAGGPAFGPAFSSGAEQRQLQDTLRRGIRNPRQLSNIIFFARHPDRSGSPIRADETQLIGEWRQIRERIVLPALRQLFGGGNGAIGPRRVEPPGRRDY